MNKETITFTNGAKYVGDVSDNKMNGKGVLTFPDGRIFEGEFKNNKPHGTISLLTSDNKKITYHYSEGKKIKTLEDNKEEQELPSFFISDSLEQEEKKGFKDDQTTMDYPFFSLSTKRDLRVLEYQITKNNGDIEKVKISPNVEYGRPTIFDKDILIYCNSIVMNELNKGNQVSRRIRLKAHKLLKETGRATSGEGYKKLEKSLNRLGGVFINTNLKTNNTEIKEGFGVLDSWKVIEKENGRMEMIEITMSEWFYNSIIGQEVITVNPNYFKLRKPMEKRIYEIGRKFCGKKQKFAIGLEKFKKKFGTSDKSVRSFKQKIKNIIEEDKIPDYAVIYDEAKDQILFYNKRDQKYLLQQSEIDDLQTFRGKGISEIAISNAKKIVKDSNTNLSYNALVEEYFLYTQQKGKPNNPSGAFINFIKQKIKASKSSK